jgi:hypothetical protein
VADEDAEAVKLVKKSGAILIATTIVPELAFWWETVSPIRGVARNPYDFRRSPGGSSGGEVSRIRDNGIIESFASRIKRLRTKFQPYMYFLCVRNPRRYTTNVLYFVTRLFLFFTFSQPSTSYSSVQFKCQSLFVP